MKHTITAALVVIALSSTTAMASCDKVFAKVGAGYKFDENDKFSVNGVSYDTDYHSPYSARFEVGVECDTISYGVAHHSQWTEGAPFNDNPEFSKTEIFIDYKFEWSL